MNIDKLYTEKINIAGGHMYREAENVGNKYREEYLSGLHKVIADRLVAAKKNRELFIEGLTEDRESYRKKYCDMLGWPLNEEPHPIKSVSEEVIYETEQEIYSRMQFEMFEGFRFYGILFRHKKEEALPLVIAQHGGDGTPELCSDFFGSANYNDMTMRLFRQGVNVFAPQLALWKSPEYGADNQRNEIDTKLKQLGGSITAVEIYCIMRCIDYFQEKQYCNNSFGMCGLSYGGFYTLHTTAADTRIRAALTSSHFNDRVLYGWSSKSFYNAANTFLDAEVAGLICPRYLEIHVGDADELFDAAPAEAEYERAKKYFKEAPENIRFHIFQGGHEFCPNDDEVIKRFIAKLNS